MAAARTSVKDHPPPSGRHIPDAHRSSRGGLVCEILPEKTCRVYSTIFGKSYAKRAACVFLRPRAGIARGSTEKEISERLPVWWPLSCAPTLMQLRGYARTRVICCCVHLNQEISTLSVTSMCLNGVEDAFSTQNTAGQSQQTRGRRDLYLGARALLQALHVVTLPSTILIAGVHHIPKNSR